MKTNIYLFFVVLIGTAFIFQSCNRKGNSDNMEKELSEFLKKYADTVGKLQTDAAIAYFNATISGKDEDYKKSADLSVKYQKYFTDKQTFTKLKAFKDSKQIKDTLLLRQLELIYNAFLGNQADEKKYEDIIRLQNNVEKRFSTFRAEINGKKITDNEIEEILGTSKNSEEVKNAWLASKKIGKEVAEDVIKLVKMRNEVAKQLGFNNYHEMTLKLDEQDPEQVRKLFDELDSLTRNAFAKEKEAIDEYFAKHFNIKKDELMPWHYQNRFFQEAPKIYKADLDIYYKGKDIVDLAKKYFNGIGLSIDKIVEKSDLFEKEGKYQHAYCTDIDRKGDVRMVCNIKPNKEWMGTMLHESGHAVYSYYIPMSVPFQLKDAAHTFTTEAIAELFGRFASNGQWMKDVVGISDDDKKKIEEDAFKSLRLQQLAFSRWAQVMYRFEKSMYENPDQDLNKLWWDIVEKYQMLKRPKDRNEPDWASKIHIASVPCYYHNYLLGELLASQLYVYVYNNFIKTQDYKNQSFANRPEIGTYFKDKVFAAGKIYFWNEMIRRATGEELTAKYYAMQFVQ